MAAPRLLEHCKATYTAMDGAAQTAPDGKGSTVRFWEGSGTKLVQSIGLSNPYYSQVFQALKAMDCIRQGRRGGGGLGSVWYLLQEPTEELWNLYGEDAMKKDGKASAASLTEMDQRIKALLQQLNRQEQRIAILEAKVNLV